MGSKNPDWKLIDINCFVTINGSNFDSRVQKNQCHESDRIQFFIKCPHFLTHTHLDILFLLVSHACSPFYAFASATLSSHFFALLVFLSKFQSTDYCIFIYLFISRTLCVCT
jgi:hypothetical protein